MNIKKFAPLMAIFSIIAAFTLGMQIAHGWSLENAMLDFRNKQKDKEEKKE